jgi:hypothetical protein
MGVAVAKLGVNLLVIVVSVSTLYRLRGIRLAALATRAYRPLCAAGVMILGSLSLTSLLPEGTLPALLFKILVGAALYVVSVIALWVMAGRPNGPERIVFDWGRSLLARMKGAF